MRTPTWSAQPRRVKLDLHLGSDVSLTIKGAYLDGSPYEWGDASDWSLVVTAEATGDPAITLGLTVNPDAGDELVVTATKESLAAAPSEALVWAFRHLPTEQDWLVGPVMLTSTGSSGWGGGDLSVTVGDTVLSVVIPTVSTDSVLHREEFGELLVRAAARSLVDSPVARLGPTWHIDSRVVALSPPDTSYWADVYGRHDGCEAAAAALIGMSGLPSATGARSEGTRGAGPEITGSGKTAGVVPAGAWSGLQARGGWRKSAGESWPSTSLEIRWSAQLSPALTTGEAKYMELFLTRNHEADPAYSFVEFGVKWRGPLGSEHEDAGSTGGTEFGLYLYLDYAGPDEVPREWFSDRPIYGIGGPHDGVFKLDVTTGQVDATIEVNGRSTQTVTGTIEPMTGLLAPPSTDPMTLGPHTWGVTRFSIGEIDEDPIHSFDTDGAAEGDVEVDGWATGGGAVLAPFDGPRIIGSASVGHVVSPSVSPDLMTIPADGSWTMTTRLRPWGTEEALIAAGGAFAYLWMGASALAIFTGDPGWALMSGTGSYGGAGFDFVVKDSSAGVGLGVHVGVEHRPTETAEVTIRLDRDADLMSMWIDGEKVSEASTSGLGEISSPDPIAVLPDIAQADMEHMAIWQRALTDSEIAGLA